MSVKTELIKHYDRDSAVSILKTRTARLIKKRKRQSR